MFQVSSQSGRILPLEAVASFCEEHNIVVVVDGTQSCQLLLSAQKKQILDRVDFFVMSTHKWIGNVKTCGLIRLISIFDKMLFSILILLQTRYKSLGSTPCPPAISFGWEPFTSKTATVEKVFQK